MRYLAALVAAVAFFNIAPLASAETKENMVKFVDEAAAFLKKEGPEKAFAKFNDKNDTQFHKGELYVYVYDYTGKCLSHGIKAELIGRDSIKLKDKKGTPVVEGLLKAAKDGKGFFEYYWPNPVSGNNEKKLSYNKDIDGKMVVGSGIYMGK